MIIVECGQRSPEWHAARLGIPTASEFGKIITPGGEPSKQAETLLYRCVGEWATGVPEEGYRNHWMERGAEMEEEALAFFQLQTDQVMRPTGFVYKDERRLTGCSPDGLLMPDYKVKAGLEMKCPSPGVHVRYLLQGEVPTEYKPQIQGSMWITDADHWYFLSYHPHAQPVLLKVGRNDLYIKSLSAAVERFIEQMLVLREELTVRGLVNKGAVTV